MVAKPVDHSPESIYENNIGDIVTSTNIAALANDIAVLTVWRLSQMAIIQVWRFTAFPRLGHF